MTEVDVVIGKKRRLPLWMLGVTAADQVRKSGKDDEYFELNEERLLQKPLRSKLKPIAKRAGKRKISHEKEASEVQPVLLVRCDKRETISKSGKKAVNSDNVAGKDCKTSLENLKNRRRGKGSVTKHASPKMRKMENHGLEISDSFEGSPASEESGDDDGDLTMEDLISMAEQYVKADNQNEAPTSRSEPNLEQKIPQPSKKPIFSRREWGLEPVKSGQEASMSVTVGPTIAHSIDTERKASQGHTVGTGITKDPTDDMLEIFLGPLFKKPQIEEVETTFVEEEDEHNFSQDIARVEEDEAPLMKKKSSSLKDTVAMFF